jgi:PEP-CTERM motif
MLEKSMITAPNFIAAIAAITIRQGLRRSKQFVGLLVCVFCGSLLSASRAEAGVMYSTLVDSKFSIAADSIELGMPFGGSSVASGNGIAYYFGSATTSAVSASLHVEVSGSAFAPPVSFASSTFMSGHVFTIDNLGGPGLDTSEIKVPFVFEYSWDIDLAHDFPGSEFASAGAFFDISGIDNEKLFVTGLGFIPRYLHHIRETTLLGGTGSSGGMKITGEIVVPAETLSKFSVITDTTGLAAAVPEPSSLIVFGLGALVLLASRCAGLFGTEYNSARPSSPLE